MNQGAGESEGQDSSPAAEETCPADTPADVVALFRWAKLTGLPYRDFTDARREHRASVRRDAALHRRDAEASAKSAAEQAADSAQRAALEAAERARFHAGQARNAAERRRQDEVQLEEAARERALVEAEQWSRRAAVERMEAARRAEALRAAEQLARREAVQTARSAKSARSFATQQSADFIALNLPTRTPDDHPGSAQINPASSRLRPLAPVAKEEQSALENMIPTRTPLRRDHSRLLLGASENFDENASAQERLTKQEPIGFSASVEPGAGASESSALESARVDEDYARSQLYVNPAEPNVLLQNTASFAVNNEPLAHDESPQGAAPSWFGSPLVTAAAVRGASPLKETLQHSKEKVAGRWFALRGILQGTAAEAEPTEDHTLEEEAPVLALYSVAGGVGKTSLAASLTRALAAQGERVLLVDATDRGVLPFYFGARDLRPGVMRTFAPPAGNTDQPISLITYGDASASGEETGDVSLVERIRKDRKGFSRVLVDLDSAASSTLQQLIGFGADVLIPVTPDMNSVISLPVVRRALGSGSGRQPESARASFLLAQFDPSQALQLDVREILQQQLREQLLPYTVRRSFLVAEALAEGMTVIDYSPGEGISKDYFQVAAWVRALAEPAREGLAQARWSER